MPLGDLSGKKLWEKLAAARNEVLNRAHEASALTIPSILPDREVEHRTESWELPTPWQGIGARGVNNLSSKLLISLMPPSAPFFRLRVDELVIEQALDAGEEGLDAIEKDLAKIEMAVMREVEIKAIRVPAFEAFKHLIVTGNALLHFPPGVDDPGMRVFHLDQFVIERDGMGQPHLIVTKEVVSRRTAPQAVLDAVNDDNDKDDGDIVIFTILSREGRRWFGHQDVDGNLVEGTESEWPLDAFPWVPLRLTAISGENYGRGLVEEYLGDMRSLDGLQKAILTGTAASVRLLFLVNPAGTTELEDLAQKPNGAFAEGNADDVKALQTEKAIDLRVALEASNRIEDRLSRAFLLNTAIQRDAERVTAEEVRFVARELEDTLGGVYSILTQDFQLPMVRLLMRRMNRQRRLPKLSDIVEPTIVTGLDALGRSHELSRLQVALNMLVNTLGPERTAQLLNGHNAANRILISAGVKPDGLLLSQEQLQQQAVNQRGDELIEQFGNQIVDIINQRTSPQ